MRKVWALLMCIALAVPGCASGGPPRVNTPQNTGDRAVLASYVKQLPVGSRVRVILTDGHTVKGSLMQASDASIVVQRRTRIPEAPDTLPLDRVAAVEIDTGGSTARSIWIGFAAGAAGAAAVLMVLAALFAGD